MGDLGSISGWEDPLEEGMATHSSILAWRIPMDKGAWWAIIHGVTKSWTRLSDFHFHFTFNFSSGASLVAQSIKNLPAMQEIWVQFLGQEDPLEKEMVTLSSILAWRIPMDKGAWQATLHGVTKSWT